MKWLIRLINENEGIISLATLTASLVAVFFGAVSAAVACFAILLLMLAAAYFFKDESSLPIKNLQKAEPVLTKEKEEAPELTTTSEVSDKLAPMTILEEIKKHAPLQREVIADSYVGVKVGWKVTLLNVRKDGKGGLVLMTKAADQFLYPWIYATVKEDLYPQLKIMKEGDAMEVEGVINKVEETIITLEEAKLIL